MRIWRHSCHGPVLCFHPASRLPLQPSFISREGKDWGDPIGWPSSSTISSIGGTSSRYIQPVTPSVEGRGGASPHYVGAHHWDLNRAYLRGSPPPANRHQNHSPV